MGNVSKQGSSDESTRRADISSIRVQKDQLDPCNHIRALLGGRGGGGGGRERRERGEEEGKGEGEGKGAIKINRGSELERFVN